MKKSDFITLVLGTLSGLLFALGMCMCLLPEWGVFEVGIGFGAAGIIGFLITIVTYRKLTGKKPVKVHPKTVGKIVYGVFASLVFGVGMAMTMAYEGMMLPGIMIGIVGIILLLCLIPMCLGIKKED